MHRWLVGILACFAALTLAPAYANTIENIRVWPAPDNTRVVFDLSETPAFSYFTLYDSKPYRLVIDFENTSRKVDVSKVPTDSLLISKIRLSTPKNKQSTRIVFELTEKVDPSVFPLAANDRYGERLVVDLPGRSIARSAPVLRASDLKERKVTVAIDPGHGGDDPGSIGPGGTYEKHVVLKISRALADMINEDPAMQAYLIRSDDYYVGLKARTRKAEEIKADLLVSVHADAFTTPQPRGASVWVLSNRRANNEMGRLLEDKERLSDVLGGVEISIQTDDTYGYLNEALVSMSMDHAMASGYEAAEEIINEMKKITRMHKSKPQHASLAVLTSGSVPSMLVETGFISNPDEERLLLSNKYQQQIARAVYHGVRSYFTRKPPDGTYFATNRASKHVVKSGESLSVLAERYNTSVQAIKERNKLKSSMLKIGQVLDIPSPG